jgi:tetratricopeptide (TPR) repeat protein
MHSIFRIAQVKQIEENDRLWQVQLTLTSDSDPQLQTLTKSIQEETKGSRGWFQLGRLLMTVAQYDKAQQLFDIMLEQTTDERKKGEIYHYLGWIKMDQGKHTEALSYYQNSLKLRQKTLPENHPDLAACYNTISVMYDKMGEYSKALSYHKKGLEIRQKTLPANHPSLATIYNNVGLVYNNMGEYSKVLSCYKKGLEIYQKILPANHPLLATSYNNIGNLYYFMNK